MPAPEPAMGLSLSSGEVLALSCAFVWALNGLILRSQSQKISPATMNMTRCGVGGCCFWMLLPFGDPLSNLGQVALQEWLLLGSSVVIGVVIGDTLYLSALREIGVARTMPLVGTYPLTTLFFEWLLLRHPAGFNLLLGTCLVVAGVILISTSPGQRTPSGKGSPGQLKLGVILALAAAVLWGLSTVLLKPALTHISAVHASAIRMPMVALLLFLTKVLPDRKESLRGIDLRTFLVVASTGVLGMFIGSLMYLVALKHASAGKVVTLTSFSPVFAVIMAAIFLQEKLNTRILLGMGLCTGGVLMVV